MIDNVNHLLYLEIIKMGSGRALQKSLSIRNGRGYKAKLGLGFFYFFLLRTNEGSIHMRHLVHMLIFSLNIISTQKYSNLCCWLLLLLCLR